MYEDKQSPEFSDMEATIIDDVDNSEERVETISEQNVDVEVVNNKKFGVVMDRTTLNVRDFPFKTAEIITTLSANSVVEVDLDQSTEEFYKICNAAGIEGFCMKQFIELTD